jgi:hypothetical protein
MNDFTEPLPSNSHMRHNMLPHVIINVCVALCREDDTVACLLYEQPLLSSWLDFLGCLGDF